MKNLILFFLFLLIGQTISAQSCQEGESQITFTFRTDFFPSENAFRLFSADSVYFDIDFGSSQYQQNEEYVFETCVSAESCITFQFDDTVGDGLFLSLIHI